MTGGSRGIGQAIARALAIEGVDVALRARNTDALVATAAELAAESGRTVVGVSADTTGDAQTQRAVNEAAAVLTKEVEAQMAAGNSIHHPVDASEVANVVAFPCSPKSRAIDGDGDGDGDADAIAVGGGGGGGAPGGIHSSSSTSCTRPLRLRQGLLCNGA